MPIGRMLRFEEFLELVVPGQLVSRAQEASIVLAVDAPLGFPAGFRRLLCAGSLEFARPPREIQNPLAYRDTDRHVFEVFAKKPLSAAFDRLGNNATVAICHVRLWQREDGFSVAPVIGQVRPLRTIIEVYPALIKGRAQAALEPLRRFLPRRHMLAGTDEYDAALCALHALAFAAEGAIPGLPLLARPPKLSDSIREEGWIYYMQPRALKWG